MTTWIAVPVLTASAVVLGAQVRNYYVTNSASNLKITHPKAIEEQKKAKEEGKVLLQTIKLADLTPVNIMRVAKNKINSAIEGNRIGLGDIAPNFKVFDLNGNESNLLDFHNSGRPLVINFGSYT